jgi:hypothetical protein
MYYIISLIYLYLGTITGSTTNETELSKLKLDSKYLTNQPNYITTLNFYSEPLKSNDFFNIQAFTKV